MEVFKESFHRSIERQTQDREDEMPNTLHSLTLFSHLDRCTSTCLGLTNKYFYVIHRELHGEVGLHENPLYQILPSYLDPKAVYLGSLLRSWIPSGLIFNDFWRQPPFTLPVFLTKERYQEVKQDCFFESWYDEFFDTDDY